MLIKTGDLFSKSVIVFSIVTFCVFCGHGIYAKGVIIDRILAVANGDIVTLSDLLIREKLLYKMDSPPEDMSTEAKMKIREKIMQDLIDEKLMISEAKRLGLAPSDAEVSEIINEIKIRSNISSDEEFERYVRKEGLTLEDLKEKRANEIAIARVRERMIYYNVEVTQEDILNYYESEWAGYKEGVRVKLSHILLKLSDTNDPRHEKEIFKKAEELIQRYQNGEPFSELAARFSEDEKTAHLSGSLGVIKIEDLIPEFADAIEELKPPSITGPVKTKMGFHILLLEDRKSFGLEKGSIIWNKIFETLTERKKAEFLDSWIKRLRKEANIEIKHDVLEWQI